MKTLIKNGRVIDPSCRIDAMLNILAENGRIASFLPLGCHLDADVVIDANNQVVAPGFIDIHMHEDPVASDGTIRQSIFPAMLRMGVTTVLAGNCGDNVYDPAAYLDIIDEKGTAVNVAMLAGHTWMRSAAGQPDKYAPADASVIADIKKRMVRALKAGCVGISFGLRYVPGMTTAEYLEVASCACDPEIVSMTGRKMLVAAHVRDDADYVFDSAEEFFEAGRRYGVPLELSHIGSMGGFGQMEKLLCQMDLARASGVDVSADCYPYDAFCTNIGSSTYDDGWLMRYQCGYDAVEMCEGKYKGRRCTKEIFDEMRRDDPEALTICYVMQADDIRLAFHHPNVLVGSDGILNDGQGHPRAAGAFPRFLAEYVQKGSLSLYEGIEKMTTLAASRIGLKNKGTLAVGADADIVVFDPVCIHDCSTFSDPLLPPVGISHVLIGGIPAVSEGRIVNDRLGRSVRWNSSFFTRRN